VISDYSTLLAKSTPTSLTFGAGPAQCAANGRCMLSREACLKAIRGGGAGTVGIYSTLTK